MLREKIVEKTLEENVHKESEYNVLTISDTYENLVDDSIEDLVDTYNEVTKEIKRLNNIKNIIAGILIRKIKAKRKDYLEINGYKISLERVILAKIDKDKLKEEMPEIYDKYLVLTPYERLKVKKI